MSDDRKVEIVKNHKSHIFVSLCFHKPYTNLTRFHLYFIIYLLTLPKKEFNPLTYSRCILIITNYYKIFSVYNAVSPMPYTNGRKKGNERGHVAYWDNMDKTIHKS